MDRTSRVIGPVLLLPVLLVACSSGEDNSPEVGKVPPKPNPNMNAELPESVRQQISQSKPGSDAAAMSRTRPHGKS